MDRGKLQKGEKVFISGGAGGVGSYALQLAKNIIGAEVITTASEKKKDICQKLGADQIIDYHKEKFKNVLKDIDLCFDTTGEVSECISITKQNGKVITIAGIPSSNDIDTASTSWFVPILLDTLTWKKRKQAKKEY